jgi:cytochrome c biogenesis factor
MGNILWFISLGLTSLSILLWLFMRKEKTPTLQITVTIVAFIAISALFAFYAGIFLGHQFQYAVVHQHSNMSMSKPLLLASVWTGQTGSLLAWILSLVLVSCFLLGDRKHRSGILPLILLFLSALLIMFQRAEPFKATLMNFSDGLGLNPVLSHPLLITHPPFAFIAYSAIVAIFAYAIIAITNADFAYIFHKMHQFSVVAFASLSLTILLGSFWAYEVTGWGGYWSFDPIENGSLIAWLLLAVVLHYLKLYRRSNSFHKAIIVTSILLMFSILHMVFLIRSGLLSEISAHSYVEGRLLWMLLSLDLAVLILPGGFFLFHSKKLPSTPPLKSKKIKAIVSVNYVLLAMVTVLFSYNHFPIIESYLPFLTQLSTLIPLPRIMFFLSLVSLFFLLKYYRHAFQVKRSSRFSPEKTLIVFLISLVIVYLFQPSLPVTIFSLAGLGLTLTCSFCFICIYALLSHWNKTPWNHRGSLILHVALSVLLPGSLLLSFPVKTHWLHLVPNQSVYNEQLSAGLVLSSTNALPIYTGDLTTYSIKVAIKSSNWSSLVSIWTYQRSKEEDELMIPSITSKFGSDHHIVPVGTGIFRIKTNDTRAMGDYLVTFVSKAEESISDNIKKEIYTLSFKKDNETETIQLLRLVNPQGLQVRSDPVYVKLFAEEIRLTEYQNNTLFFSSPFLEKHLEVNYYIKPLAIVIRLAYYLILIGSAWILISIFIFRKKRITHA